MSTEEQPVSSNADEVGNPLVPIFQLEEISKADRKWELQLHPGHMAIRPVNESQPYIILRADLMSKFEYAQRMRLLVFQKPVKPSFKLSEDQAKVFLNWLGPPTKEQLVLILKRRYGWVLPISLVFIVTSVPMAGDPAAGRPDLKFNPVNLVLGLGLLTMWWASKKWPHRNFFLFDSIWFLVLAGQLCWAIYSGTSSKYWLIMVALIAWVIANGTRHYKRFATMKEQP